MAGRMNSEVVRVRMDNELLDGVREVMKHKPYCDMTMPKVISLMLEKGVLAHAKEVEEERLTKAILLKLRNKDDPDYETIKTLMDKVKGDGPRAS